MIVTQKQQRSNQKEDLAEIRSNLEKENLALKKDKEVKKVLQKVIKLTDTI